MSKFSNFFVFLAVLFSFNLVAFSQEGTAKVKGRVTNYFGDPLDNVEVKFFLLEMKSGEYISAQGKFIKSSFTNKDGEYEISGLLSGEYRVNTSAAGFPKAEVWKFYLWRNAERILDLGLKVGIIHGFPQLEVLGTVKQKNGKPIENATVTLINAFDETDVKKTRTNKDGKYKIEFIQPGQYIIYFSKPGFSVSTFSLLMNGLNGTVYPETETNKKIDVELLPLIDSNVKN